MQHIERAIETALSLAQEVQEFIDAATEASREPHDSQLLRQWDADFAAATDEIAKVGQLLRDVAEGRGGHETCRQLAQCLLGWKGQGGRPPESLDL